MLVVNFSHPLTEAQLSRIGELAGRAVERVVTVPTQFDHGRAFADQVRKLLDGVELSADAWQTTPLVVNLPSFAGIAAVLLAELHGRTGYFPTIVRLSPITGSTPPGFEVAELINLQQVRDAGRTRR